MSPALDNPQKELWNLNAINYALNDGGYDLLHTFPMRK